MVKTNKEVVDRLENDAWVAAWDKGEDEIDPDCKIAKCENCRFRNWGISLSRTKCVAVSPG